MQRSPLLHGSLRYRRPHWMLHLKNVKFWRVYAKTGAGFQRTETLYQAWLGGIDRPYMRPKCTHRTPTWLTKKRFQLETPHLVAETPAEKVFLEFHLKYFAYHGTLRPTPEDLHSILDLVERHLDLSYACRVLSHLTNDFVVRLERESFSIFIDACMRVDRRDLMNYALANAEKLGFWHVDENCRKFIEGDQSWYKIEEGKCYPLEENVELNSPEMVAMRLKDDASLVAQLEKDDDSPKTSESPNVGNKNANLTKEELELLALEEELRKTEGN